MSSDCFSGTFERQAYQGANLISSSVLGPTVMRRLWNLYVDITKCTCVGFVGLSGSKGMVMAFAGRRLRAPFGHIVQILLHELVKLKSLVREFQGMMLWSGPRWV